MTATACLASPLVGTTEATLHAYEASLPALARSLSDLSLVSQVGAGAASVVYYALCRRSHLPLAVKVYEKAKLSRLNRHQVDREITIHSQLSHPHIVDFYAAFEDEHRLYLLMEYAAGGDLFDEVKRRGGRLSEQEVACGVLAPYLEALCYLDVRGVIHRDIKPENTVFSKAGVLKVADFGLAIHQAQERPVTRLGTLDYMSPEVLRCPDKQSPEDHKDRTDLVYGAAVDCWALGVLAYELLVGRPPFGMSSRDDTMRAICSAAPHLPDWLSPGAVSFITSALNPNPALRPSVAALRHHPWVVGATVDHMGRQGPLRLGLVPRLRQPELSVPPRPDAPLAQPSLASQGVATPSLAGVPGLPQQATAPTSGLQFVQPGQPQAMWHPAHPFLGGPGSASSTVGSGGGGGGGSSMATSGSGLPYQVQPGNAAGWPTSAAAMGSYMGSVHVPATAAPRTVMHNRSPSADHRLCEVPVGLQTPSGAGLPPLAPLPAGSVLQQQLSLLAGMSSAGGGGSCSGRTAFVHGPSSGGSAGGGTVRISSHHLYSAAPGAGASGFANPAFHSSGGRVSRWGSGATPGLMPAPVYADALRRSGSGGWAGGGLLQSSLPIAMASVPCRGRGAQQRVWQGGTPGSGAMQNVVSMQLAPRAWAGLPVQQGILHHSTSAHEPGTVMAGGPNAAHPVYMAAAATGGGPLIGPSLCSPSPNGRSVQRSASMHSPAPMMGVAPAPGSVFALQPHTLTLADGSNMAVGATHATMSRAGSGSGGSSMYGVARPPSVVQAHMHAQHALGPATMTGTNVHRLQPTCGHVLHGVGGGGGIPSGQVNQVMAPPQAVGPPARMLLPSGSSSMGPDRPRGVPVAYWCTDGVGWGGRPDPLSGMGPWQGVMPNGQREQAVGVVGFGGAGPQSAPSGPVMHTPLPSTLLMRTQYVQQQPQPPPPQHEQQQQQQQLHNKQQQQQYEHQHQHQHPHQQLQPQPPYHELGSAHGMQGGRVGWAGPWPGGPTSPPSALLQGLRLSLLHGEEAPQQPCPKRQMVVDDVGGAIPSQASVPVASDVHPARSAAQPSGGGLPHAHSVPVRGVHVRAAALLGEAPYTGHEGSSSRDTGLLGALSPPSDRLHVAPLSSPSRQLPGNSSTEPNALAGATADNFGTAPGVRDVAGSPRPPSAAAGGASRPASAPGAAVWATEHDAVPDGVAHSTSEGRPTHPSKRRTPEASVEDVVASLRSYATLSAPGAPIGEARLVPGGPGADSLLDWLADHSLLNMATADGNPPVPGASTTAGGASRNRRYQLVGGPNNPSTATKAATLMRGQAWRGLGRSANPARGAGGQETPNTYLRPSLSLPATPATQAVAPVTAPFASADAAVSDTPSRWLRSGCASIPINAGGQPLAAAPSDPKALLAGQLSHGALLAAPAHAPSAMPLLSCPPPPDSAAPEASWAGGAAPQPDARLSPFLAADAGMHGASAPSGTTHHTMLALPGCADAGGLPSATGENRFMAAWPRGEPCTEEVSGGAGDGSWMALTPTWGAGDTTQQPCHTYGMQDDDAPLFTMGAHESGGHASRHGHAHALHAHSHVAVTDGGRRGGCGRSGLRGRTTPSPPATPPPASSPVTVATHPPPLLQLPRSAAAAAAYTHEPMLPTSLGPPVASSGRQAFGSIIQPLPAAVMALTSGDLSGTDMSGAQAGMYSSGALLLRGATFVPMGTGYLDDAEPEA